MPRSNEVIRFQPVKVLTSGQSAGMLAFVDGALAAVLVRLDDTHDELEGKWYAEAAFDSLERMEEHTFDTLDEAERWIRSWLHS